MTGEMDYGEQPDRQVVGVKPDEIDPSYSQVEFNDGTMETMPTSQAEALPQAPPPLTPEELAAQGAPPPLTPGELAGTGTPAAPSAPPAMGGPPVAPGMMGMFSGASPEPETVAVAPTVGTGAPQVDMGEIVAPAQPGGFADYGATTSESATSTDTVDDAQTMAGRVDDAYDAQARGDHLRDSMGYSAKRDTLDTELDLRDQQVAEQQRMLKQAELERAEHERIFKAVEATPIDEDAFWSESPGRTAGAWIALALSGFLQGATRGQNPALNQMVQALNHAQDRYVQNQQKSRDGQLRTRERLMGSLDNAISTTRLQLSGIMEKRIMLEAQREGLQPPPALSTYLAQGAVKRAEAKNAIGARVAHSATVQSQREQRATPGTGPQTRFDVQLRALGVTPEKHQKAITEGDLGKRAQSAQELRQIHGALQKIAQANGGQLPAQGTMSWTQLGLAPLAARLGIDNAEQQVNTTQLLNQASLAYMGAIGNIKGLDSNVERERFEKVLNSGEGRTTLAAIDERAKFAEDQALATASAFAGGNARRYLDLLGSQLNEPERGSLTTLRKRTGPTEAQTIQSQSAAQAPGGAAPGPLPHAARALATSTTGSRPGTYQRLRGSKPNVRP